MFEAAITCLALNVYFEARNQPMVGQIAVAQVVMHRVYDERYPNDVCEVVTQGQRYSWDKSKLVRDKCQFSWFCDGKSDKPTDIYAWEKAVMIASGVYRGVLYDMVDRATHYHSVDVLPSWSESKQYIVRINDHVFYRWEK
jgi:spore germination cell wall hydrolase CwlJ-like protein